MKFTMNTEALYSVKKLRRQEKSSIVSPMLASAYRVHVECLREKFLKAEKTMSLGERTFYRTELLHHMRMSRLAMRWFSS
jgi:hypothetical protein